MRPTFLAIAAACAIAVSAVLPAAAQTTFPGGQTSPTNTMPSETPQTAPSVDIPPPAFGMAPLGNGVTAPGNTNATKTPGGIVGGPGGASHSVGGNGS
jgi:hypothetical protein